MSGRCQRRMSLSLEQLERRDLLSVGSWRTYGPPPGRVSDDFGNTFAEATQVALTSSGAGSLTGKIAPAFDVDMFQIVAPVTGQMTIQEVALSGSRLDPYLYVYDSHQQLIAQNDDNGKTLNSQVVIDVTAGETYYVKAAAYHRTRGAYTLELVTVESVPDETGTTTDPDTGAGADPSTSTPTHPDTGATTGSSAFQIDVIMTGFTAAQQAIVQQAIDIWEQIIIGDLPDVTYRGQVIDDVSITISSMAIDGRGSVLGQSSATAYRSDSYLPYLGFIQLDAYDVASMQSSGSLLDVITHEIAHVLGFGVIWSELGLLTNTRTSSPGFTGAHAVAEYNALFGTNLTAVPVEADGGSGTALSHWEESLLNNELMTGWYNSGQTNPLSRITVASMADLGYQVNMDAAQSYAVATSSASASTASSNSYSFYGSASDLPWQGRQRHRVRAIDQIMASHSTATSRWL